MNMKSEWKGFIIDYCLSLMLGDWCKCEIWKIYLRFLIANIKVVLILPTSVNLSELDCSKL